MVMPQQPWRDGFGPASFRGAFFHVESDSLTSGRRLAVHEYPKRDTPYAEDMGRSARAFRITAYLVGPDYIEARDALRDACELEGPGTLLLPKLSAMQVACNNYSVTEFRERGGYCMFELQFVEAGLPGFSNISNVSSADALAAGANVSQGAGEALNRDLSGNVAQGSGQ